MFWKDLWLGNQTLRECFPRLFELETQRDCIILDIRREYQWIWQRRRLIRGGEEDLQYHRLMEALESVTFSNSDDKWWWDIGDAGIFTVAKNRKWIDNNILPSSGTPIRWNRFVPYKVNIFV